MRRLTCLYPGEGRRRGSLLILVVVAGIAVAVPTGLSVAQASPKLKPPRISPHPDVRAEATGPRGAVVTYRPAVVRGATSVTYSKKSGTLFPLGATTVTITARNRAGVSRATFKVIVVARPNHPPQFPSEQQTKIVTSNQYNDVGVLTGAVTTISLATPASDPDSDPLTYAWSVEPNHDAYPNVGTISGSDLTATWTRVIQYGKLAPGTVTVTVSDGRGGSDTFTIKFR